MHSEHLNLSRRAALSSAAGMCSTALISIILGPSRRAQLEDAHPDLKKEPELVAAVDRLHSNRAAQVIAGVLNKLQIHQAATEALLHPSATEIIAPGVSELRDDKLRISRDLSFRGLPVMQILNAFSKAMILGPISSLGLTQLTAKDFKSPNINGLTKNSAKNHFSLMLLIQAYIFFFNLSKRSKAIGDTLHLLHSAPNCVMQTLRHFNEKNIKDRTICFLTSANQKDEPSLYDYLPDELRQEGIKLLISGTTHNGKTSSVDVITYHTRDPRTKKVQPGYYQEYNGQQEFIEPKQIVRNLKELTISIA